MKDLRLVLDDLNFEQLVELGRSAIPEAAPQWTDHNIHDPGIMLLELLAWTADAQIYALGRSRVDERLAFARLLGVAATGPTPASGLVWPTTPALSLFRTSVVVDVDAAVTPDYPQAPTFFPRHRLQLTTARVDRLSTRRRDGQLTDWTALNQRDGSTFAPFGTDVGAGDRLVLRCARPGGLAADALRSDALLSIGIEVAADPRTATSGAGAEQAPTAGPGSARRLRVVFRDSSGEHAVAVATDSTDGLLRSGVLLLRVSDWSQSTDDAFELHILPTRRGLARAPRLELVQLNVLPIVQRERVTDENQRLEAGYPFQQYRLQRTGLTEPDASDARQRGVSDEEAGDRANGAAIDAVPGELVSVHVAEGADFTPWIATGDIMGAGPQARVFTLDRATGILRFGNGINGAAPPQAAPLRASYHVSAGSRGNLPPDVSWTVKGIAGVFGTSPRAVTGGVDATSLDALRVSARRAVRREHPIVTSADLQMAAEAQHDLGVTRALELPPDVERRPLGTRVLVVLGTHDVTTPDAQVETDAWLDEVRRRLTPRLPLGQRLLAVPPRLVDVALAASLVATANADLEAVRASALARVRRELALQANAVGEPVWPFGRDLTRRTVEGWLRSVEGVARVHTVRLIRAGRPAGDRIDLSGRALPRLHVTPSDIVVERPTRGGTR